MIADLDMLVVVPARGGSKRLPRKNILPLCGKSLMERTEDALREAGLSGRAVLSTDDDELAAEGRRIGWQVPFLRPAELAGDRVSTYDVVSHVLDWYRAEEQRLPEYVLLLQVTSPFRRGLHIAAAAQALQDNPEAEAVVSVYSAPHNGSNLFWGNRDFLSGVAVDGAGRQLLAANGAIYLVRTDALRDSGGFYPPRTVPLVMAEEDSLDIDTPQDWIVAEAVLSAREDQTTPKESEFIC